LCRYTVDPQIPPKCDDRPWTLHKAHNPLPYVLKIAANTPARRAEFDAEMDLCNHYRLSECRTLVTPVDHLISAQLLVLVYPYRGENAEDFLAAHGGELTEETIALLLYDVGLAVIFLHQRGLAHGDLSLPNIYIWRHHAFLIIDLQVIEEIGAPYAGVRGTPGYLPSALLEEAGARFVSAATDVFAFAWVALRFFAKEEFEWEEGSGFGDVAAFLVRVPEDLHREMASATDEAEEARPPIESLVGALGAFANLIRNDHK
jgi:serine/threonine protein kinase